MSTLSILHPVFRTTPVNSASCFQSNTCQFCTPFSEQHLSTLHPVFRTTPVNSAPFSEQHLSILHPVFRTPVSSTPCFQNNTCQFCTLFSEHLSILHPVFRTPINSTPCFQNNTCQFCTLFSEHLSILHPVFRTTPVNSAPCFQNTCQFYTLFSEQHLSILHPVFRTTPINYAPCFFLCVCVCVCASELVWPSGKAGKWKDLGLIPLQLSFLFKKVVVCRHCLVTLSITFIETLKWLSSPPILMQESFWWWQCSDRYIISLFPHLHTHFPPFSPSLISLTVSGTLSTMFTFDFFCTILQFCILSFAQNLSTLHPVFCTTPVNSISSPLSNTC